MRVRLVLVLGCALAGCRSSAPAVPTDELARPIDLISRLHIADDGPGRTRGLKVQQLVVDDRSHSVARALLAYESASTGMDPALARRWHQAGLRLIAVPVDHIDGLLRGLTPITGLREQWYGELTAWRSIVVGPGHGELTVSLGHGEFVVAPGRFRLLTRAWVAPEVTADGVAGVLRIELAIQNEEPPREPTLEQTEQRLAGHRPGLDTKGQLFAELAAGFYARPGVALVLVGESPALDWSNLPEPEHAFEDDDTEPGPHPSGEHDAEAADAQPEIVFRRPWDALPDPIGPTRLAATSLGESMLCAKAEYEPGRLSKMLRPPRKLVVVLTPRAPIGFEQMPRVQPIARQDGGS